MGKLQLTPIMGSSSVCSTCRQLQTGMLVIVGPFAAVLSAERETHCLELSFFWKLSSAEPTEWIGSGATVAKQVQTATEFLRGKKKSFTGIPPSFIIPRLSLLLTEWRALPLRRREERCGRMGTCALLPVCVHGEMLCGCRSDFNMCLCCCGDTWHTTHLLPQAAMLPGRKARLSKVTRGFYGTAINKGWTITTTAAEAAAATIYIIILQSLKPKKRDHNFQTGWGCSDYKEQGISKVNCLTQGQNQGWGVKTMLMISD